MANVKELDQKRIVGIVFKALLIDLLAFTIILPLFPRLLNYYQSEEIGQQVRSSVEKYHTKKNSNYIFFVRKLFLVMLYRFWSNSSI